MIWVKDIDSFYDFIGYVVLRAPNRFPIEDYLRAEEQMNLDKAFIELRRGVELLDVAVLSEEKLKKVESLLCEAYVAYREGEQVKGAHLLQDMEGMIFKK